MNRIVIRFAPKTWRDRYEAEVLEMLSQSPHPLLDRFDLLMTVLAMRVDERMKNMWVSRRMIGSFGFVLALTGLATMWFAAGHLTRGWAELPFHWWSAPTVIPVIFGLGVVGLAATRRGSTSTTATHKGEKAT
ncbi:MAG: hypothetical protein LC739_07685 [Actinobacteria bacterium]|nr:hypothetical protein [Actinomycetota bacterium]